MVRYFYLKNRSFPNLKDSFNAIVPALETGRFITGQIIIFGTGGDMESGTVDYADMFYNPITYKLCLCVYGMKMSNTTCGFFHPVTWNMEGFYDSQGNSDVEGATEFELERRKKNGSCFIFYYCRKAYARVSF